MEVVNRTATTILQTISSRPLAGVRDLAETLDMSTKTVVAATRSLEKQGLIEYEYINASGKGRPKKTAALTKAGLDLLRLSRILEAEESQPSGDLTRYYRLMGLDPLEAVGMLEGYYLTGLFPLLDRALDFIPRVETISLVVDPSEKGRAGEIAGWFSDKYRFILRFQPLNGSDSLYEGREFGCLERAGTVKVKIATLEMALADALADFKEDEGTALQATYILLEDRYIDYDKLKDSAAQRGKPALSRIGFIFKYANQTVYPETPQNRFPESFPADIASGEETPFTLMVRGAVAKVFNLP